MITLLAATEPPSDPTTTYVIMGAACLFIVYVMMRITKRSAKREPEQTFFPRSSLSGERRAQQDMEHLLVELSKMSREMSAQLDTRAAKLEALVQDADERIARLEALNRQAPPRPDFAMPRSDTTTAPATQPSAPTDDMAPSPSIDPTHAEVYRLADEGQTITQIAGELHRPHGEVELILALRPRT